MSHELILVAEPGDDIAQTALEALKRGANKIVHNGTIYTVKLDITKTVEVLTSNRICTRGICTSRAEFGSRVCTKCRMEGHS